MRYFVIVCTDVCPDFLAARDDSFNIYSWRLVGQGEEFFPGPSYVKVAVLEPVLLMLYLL